MKKYNLWKSTISGRIYKVDANWLPNPMYSVGWELVGTVEEQSRAEPSRGGDRSHRQGEGKLSDNSENTPRINCQKILKISQGQIVRQF